MLRMFVGALLALGICAGGLDAQDRRVRDDRAVKDRPAADHLVVGKVHRVNPAKGTLTITTRTGKRRTYTVDRRTRVLGPRGGVSDRGLRDGRLRVGARVAVVPGRNNRAREVRLDFRRRGVIRDRAVTDRGVTDRAIRDRRATDRAIRDRGTTDRAVRDRGTTDRAVRDRGTTDRGPERPVRDRNPARDRTRIDRATKDR
jgi:hypothetical protein